MPRPEIEHVAHLADFARETFDGAFAFERLRHQTRDCHEFGDQPRLGLFVDRIALLARKRAREQARTASWQVKALVEATPISGPARVGATMSLSRAMVELATLTTDMILCPFALAQRSEAKVSAVSPDCETRRVSPPGSKRRIAIAKLGGDFDIDRQPREALEPIFGGQPREIGGAAAADREAGQFRHVDRQLEGKRHAPRRHVEVMRQRASDDLGLFVNFLRHEMAIIAFVDQEGLRRAS